MPQSEFNILSVITLLGGTSLLLFGLDLICLNLKSLAGHVFKTIVEKATQTTYHGIFLGTVLTGLVQSSTAITSILVSLVQANIVNFERTIGVMLGANIGTTVTAHIMAINIIKWSLAIVCIGFLIQVTAAKDKVLYIGNAILGSGIMLFGLQLMSDSMKPLQHSEIFLDMMKNFQDPLIGILVGTLFTAVIHSSSGALGVMIGLAMQGLITPMAVIPLMLGANIGTCFTAVIVSLNTSFQARRVAASHIIFNILGVLPFIFFIPQFTEFVQIFTPQDNVPQFIANAQTIFNIITVLIAIPFVKQLAWLSCVFVPDSNKGKYQKYTIPQIDKFSSDIDIALSESKSALISMRNIIREMLLVAGKYFIKRQSLDEKKIRKLIQDHHDLRLGLVKFLRQLKSSHRKSFTIEEVTELLDILLVINECEQIVHTLKVGLDHMDGKIPEFDEGFKDLDKYLVGTIRSFNSALGAFIKESPHKAESIEAKLRMADSFYESFRSRAIEDICKVNNLEKDRLNLEVLDTLKTINSISERICEISLGSRTYINGV